MKPLRETSRSSLSPSRVLADSYIEALTGSRTTPVTFQTFSDKKPHTPGLTEVLHGTLEQHWQRLCRLNEAGAGIFITVNQTDLKGRTKDNIQRVRSLFVDMDRCDQKAVYEVISNAGFAAEDFSPQIVIRSSERGWHLYWLISHCRLQDFSRFQKRLAEKLGGDKSVSDLPRVLRLPGFFHNKSTPFLVRIVGNTTEKRYAVESLMQALAPVNDPPESSNQLDLIVGEKIDHSLVRKPIPEADIARLVEELRAALTTIPSDDRDVWQRMGHALKSFDRDSELRDQLGRELWIEWSQKSNLFDIDDANRAWESFKPDRTSYEAVFRVAKRHGWSGAKNNHAVGQGDDDKQKSQASILTDLGKAHHLFHDEGGDAYARVKVSDHIEVFAIGSASYSECLSREFYRLTGKGASRNALSDAISTLTAIAKHDGQAESVFLRAGVTPNGIALDMGGDNWGCIEISSSGWNLRTDHVINFRRSGKPMSLPSPDGVVANFDLIWKYINIDELDRPLIAGWLLGALRPIGPYPILLLIGEQGTGKSETSRVLKRLTDPSAVPLRSPPRDEKDLLVAGLSSWVLALDNLSGAKPELSDALCRMATGGGLGGRKLYTDSDETLIEVKRPVILNGIDDMASRADLAERCLHIELPPLRRRLTESDLAKGFSADSGAIFAAILNALVLAERDHRIPRKNLPRMADFAKWAAAGVPALGYEAEQFLDAYRANQARAFEAGLETSPLATVLRQLLNDEPKWRGSSRQLLAELNERANGEQHSAGWPKTEKGLITILRRLGPLLRHVGIDYYRDRTATTRSIRFKCSESKQASHVSSDESAGKMTRVTHHEPRGTTSAIDRGFDLYDDL